HVVCGWNLEFKRYLLFVFIVPAAVANRDFVSFICHGNKPEATFSFADLINALAVRPAFNGGLLVERRGAHYRNGRSATRSEITMAAIVGGEHVGITMQNGDPGDVIGFNEIGDLSALIAVDRP